MLTLNSQQEYRACETQLRDARRVLIVGGGLIGSELAMDFCRAGKAVTLIDNAASILASLTATGSKQPLAASADGDGRSSVVEISVAGAGKKQILAFWQRWTASAVSKSDAVDDAATGLRFRKPPPHDAPG